MKAKRMAKDKTDRMSVSQPEEVDKFIKKLKHPLIDVVRELRRIILSVDKEIGELIYWNGPVFVYTGEMKPFEPKEYKRYIVGFNLYQKDCIRLIFLFGAKLEDKS